MNSPSLLRRAGAALFASCLAATGLLGVAAPAAAEQTATGSAEWGVKESFRNYVQGPIAGGEVAASDGAELNADGTISWTAVSGQLDGDGAPRRIGFSGTAVFEGHDYGQGSVLEVHITDPHVEISGEEATVHARMSSREFHGADPSIPPGDLIDYGTVPVADLQGVEVTTGGDSVALSSTGAELREEAVDGFAGFYSAGSAMDPLSFTVDLEDEPASPSAPEVRLSAHEELAPEGQTLNVEGSGFEPGHGVYVLQTATLPDEGEEPTGYAPISQGAWVRGEDMGADGSFDAEITVTSTYEATGTGETVNCRERQCYVFVANDRFRLDDRSQDVKIPISFTGGDDDEGDDGEPDGNGGDGPDGPTEVHDGRADWGVKESFRDYITGTVAQGDITTSDGATRNEDDTFSFPGGAGEVDLEEATANLSFEGTVLFEGHAYDEGDPLLQLSVSEPRMEFAGDEGTLYADVTSRSLDSGESVEYPDVALADLDVVEPEVGEETITWSAIPATLTEEGVPAFADFYQAGDELDPLSIVVATEEGVDLGGGSGGDDQDGGSDDGDGTGEGGGSGGGSSGGLPKTGAALLGLVIAAVGLTTLGATALLRRRATA